MGDCNMEINAEILNSIITGATTLLVVVIGSVATYKGTIKGAKLQIENQEKQAHQQYIRDMNSLNESRKKQEVFQKNAIENFLSNEIKFNFEKIFDDNLAWELYRHDEPFNYNFRRGFVFKEYDNFKYELIKSDSDHVKETVNIYDMFYSIERKMFLQRFTQIEYENFQKSYQVCIEKYVN